jgi:hypothetical protein
MPFTNKAGQPIEPKAVAAPWATFLSTQGLWLVFTLWPSALSHFSTTAEQLQLSGLVATVLTGVAAYLAPHVHRPDLYPVSPPPGYVPATPQPVAGAA